MKIINSTDKNVLSEALQTLKAGGIIIYPTETAYGVGVDATNPDAVTKLLNYKKRPQGKAISIGVVSEAMAKNYVEINATAEHIYKEFLPGPVTVISKSKGNIDNRLESEKQTLGIRIPDAPVILEIIKQFGKPVTTTSANSSGKKTPYEINDILKNISQKQMDLIDLVIDGGTLPKRLTSTVIDTTTDDIKTYRAGSISFEKTNFEAIQSHSVEETIQLGRNFMDKTRKSINNFAVIFLLSGELGAGKTHFTKGIAQSLGITQTIKSPTYTYVNEYILKNVKRISQHVERDASLLYHLDAWRIETKTDLEELNIENMIKPRSVLVIEWPEILVNHGLDFKSFPNAQIIQIHFEVIDVKIRSLKVAA